MRVCVLHNMVLLFETQIKILIILTMAASKFWEPALDLLTRTRAPLVTSSAGADSSERFVQASNLYSHAWQHIHRLKLVAKARGYCET